jgi:hypothetical protein
MLSAFAVLRFTTSANLVGCSIGRSAGVGSFKDVAGVAPAVAIDLGQPWSVTHPHSPGAVVSLALSWVGGGRHVRR